LLDGHKCDGHKSGQLHPTLLFSVQNVENYVKCAHEIFAQELSRKFLCPQHLDDWLTHPVPPQALVV